VPDTLKEGERLQASPVLYNSLAWLGQYTSNPSAKKVLFWSLGALPPQVSERRDMEEIKEKFESLGFSEIYGRLEASTNLDELDNWLRTGIHFDSVSWFQSSFSDYDIHRIYEDYISDHHCDITSALAALAFGISPVKIFHAGQCIELSSECAITWVLDTYKEGLLDLPSLVWEPLLQKSGYNYTLPGDFRERFSNCTVSSFEIRKLLQLELPSSTPLSNSLSSTSCHASVTNNRPRLSAYTHHFP
jgi:hypothetical protein